MVEARCLSTSEPDEGYAVGGSRAGAPVTEGGFAVRAVERLFLAEVAALGVCGGDGDCLARDEDIVVGAAEGEPRPVGLPTRSLSEQTACASDVDGWAAEGLIEYLGAHSDVRPFVAAADCIVLPSYREGLPRTLLEGAAMGKPLIASDVPGCRDVVEHQANGLLCAVRDPSSLADAMIVMAEMPHQRRAEMGALGRKTVEQRFDQQIVIDLYLAAIAAALGDERSGA